MASVQYRKLNKDIDILKNQFLNFEKRTDGSYTDYELMQCRAFITFCHSEVEIYFEEMSKRIVEKAEKKWRGSRKSSKAISAMLVYRTSNNITLPKNPNEQSRRTRLDTLIGQAIAAQKNAIKANHGIKPNNLSNLFIAVGMKPEEFNDTLLVQLQNFGERRGRQVHGSSSVSLPNIRDPFDDELKDIEFLIYEIKSFDEIILKFNQH